MLGDEGTSTLVFIVMRGRLRDGPRHRSTRWPWPTGAWSRSSQPWRCSRSAGASPCCSTTSCRSACSTSTAATSASPRPSRCSGSATAGSLGIPVSVYVFLAITVAGWVLLNRTRYGRYVVAVGGNREAARIAGVPVRRTIFSVYVLMGLLAGIATVLLCARLGSASPVSGNLYELDAIGAVVIGGTSLAGGPREHRRDVPRRAHLRTHLQLDDPDEPLDGGSTGDQGRDRPRCRPASTAGGPLLMSVVLRTARTERQNPQQEVCHVAQATLHLNRRGSTAGGRCRCLWRRHRDSYRASARAAVPAVRPAAAGNGKKVKIIASVPPDRSRLARSHLQERRRRRPRRTTTSTSSCFRQPTPTRRLSRSSRRSRKKPDVLVVLPQDGAALTPVAQKAEQAGIPVVNIDRLFTEPDAATATVLGDNYQIGVLAADYIADELKCEGNVVEIQGLAGISVTEDRTKGFEEELKKQCPKGGVEIVASQPGDFNPDQGLKVMENILQAEKKHRRRVHARRRHGPGSRPGDPQRRSRGRDVPHRRRRIAGRDGADQGEVASTGRPSSTTPTWRRPRSTWPGSSPRVGASRSSCRPRSPASSSCRPPLSPRTTSTSTRSTRSTRSLPTERVRSAGRPSGCPAAVGDLRPGVTRKIPRPGRGGLC